MDLMRNESYDGINEGYPPIRPLAVWIDPELKRRADMPPIEDPHVKVIDNSNIDDLRKALADPNCVVACMTLLPDSLESPNKAPSAIIDWPTLREVDKSLSGHQQHKISDSFMAWLNNHRALNPYRRADSQRLPQADTEIAPRNSRIPKGVLFEPLNIPLNIPWLEQNLPNLIEIGIAGPITTITAEEILNAVIRFYPQVEEIYATTVLPDQIRAKINEMSATGMFALAEFLFSRKRSQRDPRKETHIKNIKGHRFFIRLPPGTTIFQNIGDHPFFHQLSPGTTIFQISRASIINGSEIVEEGFSRQPGLPPTKDYLPTLFMARSPNGRVSSAAMIPKRRGKGYHPFTEEEFKTLGDIRKRTWRPGNPLFAIRRWHYADQGIRSLRDDLVLIDAFSNNEFYKIIVEAIQSGDPAITASILADMNIYPWDVMYGYLIKTAGINPRQKSALSQAFTNRYIRSSVNSIYPF